MNTTETTIPSYQQSTNPGFWVGRAKGIQHDIRETNTIIGPSPVVMPDMPKINLSETILGPKMAVRHDEGKTDWSLVPFEALEGMADVLTFGAKKYASWNWTDGGGFSYSRVLRSCLRHIFAFMRGEDNDPESGLSHISHAQANLLFLAYYIRDKKKFNKDDRNVR